MREKLTQHLKRLQAKRVMILTLSGDAFDVGDIGAAMGLKTRLVAVEDVITAMESSAGKEGCERCNGDGVTPHYGHFDLPYAEWEWDVCRCVYEMRQQAQGDE